MENKTKKNIYGVLLLGFILIAGIMFVTTLYHNDKLLQQVGERDVLIYNSHVRDSVNQIKMDYYINKYNEFVHDGFAVVYGKKVTTDDLLRLISQQSEDRNKVVLQYNELAARYIRSNENIDTLIDVIKKKDERYNDLVKKYNKLANQFNALTDSTHPLSVFYKTVKNKYGIEMELVKNDSIPYYTLKMSPADSGLVLLNYYRDCLKYDSVKHTWTVIIK